MSFSQSNVKICQKSFVSNIVLSQFVGTQIYSTLNSSVIISLCLSDSTVIQVLVQRLVHKIFIKWYDETIYFSSYLVYN